MSRFRSISLRRVCATAGETIQLPLLCCVLIIEQTSHLCPYAKCSFGSRTLLVGHLILVNEFYGYLLFSLLCLNYQCPRADVGRVFSNLLGQREELFSGESLH